LTASFGIGRLSPGVAAVRQKVVLVVRDEGARDIGRLRRENIAINLDQIASPILFFSL
jgi:hypothetical protein